MEVETECDWSGVKILGSVVDQKSIYSCLYTIIIMDLKASSGLLGSNEWMAAGALVWIG